MNDDDLLAARNQAWIDWLDYEHEQYRPRFYKLRLGKGSHFINPFANMEEMRACRDHLDELATRYYALAFQAHERGLPRLPTALVRRWSEERTPDGPRYRKE